MPHLTATCPTDGEFKVRELGPDAVVTVRDSVAECPACEQPVSILNGVYTVDAFNQVKRTDLP